MIESWNAQKFSQLADVLLAPLYWLFSLGFILPALAIAWPCANIALRLGYASWATAIVACSILLTLLLVMGFYPTVTPLIVIIGIASGVGFGTLYWFGNFLTPLTHSIPIRIKEPLHPARLLTAA